MTDPGEPPGSQPAIGDLGYDEARARLTAPGQLFEMEDVEIGGVPLRAWKAAPPSLRSVLDLSLGYGDADFLVYEDERTTYSRHYRLAAALAHRLRGDLGVEKGDRVAIAMRNLPEWVVVFWAAAVVGAVVVPLNAWWTGGELAYALADSGARVAFVDPERAERISPHLGELPDLRRVVTTDRDATDRDAAHETATIGPTFAELLGDVADDAVPPDVELVPEDDATIFYTSGTTGRPKGAVGSHRNTCTNLMNLFFAQMMNQARWGEAPGDQGDAPQRCYLLTVPLFHATGCHAVLVTNTAAGSKIVLMRRFDAERALELIEKEKVTIFGGVPTVVMRVLDSPELARRDVSSVRSVSYGGAPAPADLVRRIREAFKTGQPGNGYGLTETSAAAAWNSGADYVRRPDSVGRVFPVVDATVVPEGFSGSSPPALVPGTAGELWLRGPNVVRGYWNRPDDTARAITTGWLHTGDVARIDAEGFVYIVDRSKDVVIRGGENVYSVEVEDALFSHPAVADCAVIGVPHQVLGEEVGAVVVLRPGHKVTADELSDHVRARLAGFNVPTRWWFRRSSLPRNPAGKLLKRALRADVLGTSEGSTEWAGDPTLWGR
ncbi:MAG TPA: AMP-binding protein [Acidimicrobiales bacterium]|nr:AMP-binding protein [Acidimicrobiales bacterium]